MAPSTDAGGRRRAARLRAEAAQLVRLQETHDPSLRDAIIEEHLPLARRVASRYAGSTESLDDLFQVACLGLVKAVDRFDPARGVAFSSYAVPTMIGELRRHFRDHGWALRVPRELQEMALDVLRTRTHLSGEMSREPSVQDVACSLRVSRGTVLDALGALSARHTQSLDQPGSNQSDADRDPIAAQMGCEDPGFERVEHRIVLQALRGRLSRGEWSILQLRLAEDLTQRQIAERVGVSQMTVSRTLRQVRGELVELARSLEDAEAVHDSRAPRAQVRSPRRPCAPLSSNRPARRRTDLIGKH